MSQLTFQQGENMNKKILTTGARLLLGLIFFVFGLNGIFNFIPAPAVMPQAALDYFGALMATKFFMPLLIATEIICGALLLARVASPLALVILAPVTLNIMLTHVFLTPGATNLINPA